MAITINDLPAQNDPHLLERLARHSTAAIGHLETQSFVSPEIRALMPGVRVVGTAITVRMPHIDSILLNYCLSYARPGDFIVMDRCGDERHAAWGGLSSLAARVRGIAGIAIDGFCTDLETQHESGVPCWAKGLTPVTCKRQGLHGEFNVPVSIGGVAVCPGDAILADTSGIFVCSAGRLEGVVSNAERHEAASAERRRRVLAGETLGEITGVIASVEAVLASQGHTSPFAR